MKKIFLFSILISFISMTQISSQTIKYPKTKKLETQEDFFGTKVIDNFRWLEDDNSAETAQWVVEQNKVTSEYLDKIPFREDIKKRLTQLWEYPKYSVPFKKGNRYFFYYNRGTQNQSVLYVQEDLKASPKILLDPNALSEDGTVSLGSVSVSHDGKYLAYEISHSGSDWSEIHVKEIANGNVLKDELKWVKFSGIAWQGDGFYYSRYDAPEKGKELSKKNEFHKVYFHKLNSLQNSDKLIYENKMFPLRNYSAQTTEDERFLLLYETESTSGNSLYCKNLLKKDKDFSLIAKGFENEYGVIDNIEDKLLVSTNFNAPRKQLVIIDPSKPASDQWKTIIPQRDEVLESIELVGEKIIATYMKDAYSKAFIYDINGKIESEIKLPCIGTLSGFSGKKGDNIAYYSFTSFNFPNIVYKYDVSSGKSDVCFESKIKFNSDELITEQVFYPSKDGTKIPMFIVHKRGIQLDGNNPTMLYGYGGFNISITPNFSISRLVFLENGGVYAVANIRGGGEYGEDWHKAGTKLKKQNVFDDFAAAAEYLVTNRYTNPEKLAISGGSNGGLLVGACMTQHPDLFKVALPAVGVMDMLHYHKFTIGWAWKEDYGSSENNVEEFKNLYSYSPLHNLKPGTKYPATLITTGDHDDRVVPAHSFKFAARLQECNSSDRPTLIRIETTAGHGAGKPTSKVIDEMT
ncbi:MAG: prolyl oligopeptidase family serine peptidase, partial [Bacteroidota bacterium]